MDILPIEIIDPDRKQTSEAARFKARGGISYADCFAAALSYLEGGALVTGDPEFEVVEDEIDLLWIPRRS